MPIQGFDSIEKHNEDLIKAIYGKPCNIKCKSKFTILAQQKIPYICDKTGKLFELTWDRLTRNLHKPHLFKENKGKFSKKEIEFLNEFYPQLGAEYCMEKLGRSFTSICTKVSELGIKKEYKKYDPEYKLCKTCNKTLHKSYFNRSNQTKDNLSYACKECLETGKRQYLENIKSTESRRKKRTLAKILSAAKIRAKKRGFDFDLDQQWIIDNLPTKCPVLNTEITFLNNIGTHGNSPSIDRIDNNKGYTKNNVHIISWRANHLKSDGNPDELYKLSTYQNNLNQEKIDYMI